MFHCISIHREDWTEWSYDTSVVRLQRNHFTIQTASYYCPPLCLQSWWLLVMTCLPRSGQCKPQKAPSVIIIVLNAYEEFP